MVRAFILSKDSLASLVPSVINYTLHENCVVDMFFPYFVCILEFKISEKQAVFTYSMFANIRCVDNIVKIKTVKILSDKILSCFYEIFL